MRHPLRTARAIVHKLTDNSEPRVLLYCGVHDGGGLSELLNSFDVIYGFDANPYKVEAAKKKFASNSKVKIILGALTDKSGEKMKLKITKNWDASSSLGTMNPDFPHMHEESSPLYNTPVEEVEVTTINLMDFCRKHRINNINMLLTDLQGLDYTVLSTMKPMIDAGKISYIQCEVEKNDKPSIYLGIPSNKERDFDTLITDQYVVDKISTEPAWWEMDVRWRRVDMPGL